MHLDSYSISHFLEFKSMNNWTDINRVYAKALFALAWAIFILIFLYFANIGLDSLLWTISPNNYEYLSILYLLYNLVHIINLLYLQTSISHIKLTISELPCFQFPSRNSVYKTHLVSCILGLNESYWCCSAS